MGGECGGVGGVSTVSGCPLPALGSPASRGIVENIVEG